LLDTSSEAAIACYTIFTLSLSHLQEKLGSLIWLDWPSRSSVSSIQAAMGFYGWFRGGSGSIRRFLCMIMDC